MNQAFQKIKVLGVGVTSASKGQVLEYLVENLINGNKKLFITTPNPEILVLANEKAEYKSILNSADLALADGVGVLVAARLTGNSLKERITGTDFVEMVCERVAEQPITIGFLGGRPGVADKASKCLRAKYPGLKVAFSVSDLASEDNSLNTLKCDLLFVAFGAPKQEEWISKNLSKLPVKAAMGVGGALDYISGTVPRAPRLIRNMGLEWLFRLIVQPWRAKRQLRLIKFIYLILTKRQY
jgi:N-acetylglucosaminyldiphosphoundecaprenol N-acetyl-beta-D-mannosaminyltransferase